MRYLVIFLLALSNFVSARQLTKVNTSWTGTWNITGGGSYLGAPLASDTVIISSNCTIANSTNAVCQKLEITAGTLTVNDVTAIAIGGDFSMTGGTLALGGNNANIIPFPSVSGTVSLTGGTVSYAANNPSQIINTIPTYFILNINRNSKSISSTLNVASNLTFSSTSTLTASANINVAGSITGSGTLNLSAGTTLDVGGTVSLTNLTCDPTSTVNYSGSGNQTGKITTYGNLVKNGTANTLTIGNGFFAENIQVLTGILAMTNCTILNSGALEVANGATLTISGSFPTGYGTTNFGSTSTINYTGSGDIEPLIYENLSLTSTARNAIGNTKVNGNLVSSNSFLNLAPSPTVFEVIGNFTGTGTIESNDGYLSIGGAFATTIVFNPSTSSTVEYSGNSAAQTIVAEQYNNLVLSGSADKTFVGTIMIDGNLSSTTSGVVSMGTSTVDFNSGNDGQIIPAFSFYRLTVSNAFKVLAGNVVVTRIGAGALSLNGTTINTGSFNIRILRNNADAITLSDPSTDYIIGNLSRNFANGTTTLPFPLGTDTLGSLPLQVQITGMSSGSGTLESNGFLTVSSTVTDPTTYPDFAGANFISTDNACNRYWTISNNGFIFTNLRAGLKFINPDDLGSAVVDPLNFLCRVNKSGTWSNGTLPNIDSDTATVSGLTLTSGNSMDIWLGELNSTYCVSKVTPANWNSAATWTCNKIPTSADTAVISLGHVITLNSTSNFARYLQIDGTAALATTATVGNIGSKGILISPTGAITRISGTPTLSSTGNLVINSATAIPATIVLAMGGTGDSIKTNQATLTIPRLTINSNVIYNTAPNLIINTDLNASATANVLTQASGTVLTLSDQTTNITLDASATNSEVIYDRGAAQTINRGTYYKLTLTSITAAAKTTSFPTGTTSTIVTNELNLETGSAASHSLNMVLSTTNLIGTGATFTMGANTALNLGVNTTTAAVTFPSTFTTYSFHPSSIVNYNTNGAQTVSGIPTYQNLNITTGASNATKTLGENTTVTSALTITNDAGTATLSLGTNTLNIAGTISGTGTLFCPTNSTVNYNSGTAQDINLAPSYYNFTTSGAGTKTIPSGSPLLIAGNLTTNGTLNTTTNSSTVDLNGTSGSQNISGTNTFYNLIKTGASSIGSVTGTQTINNLFSISNGSGLISPNGNITIIDGAALIDDNSTSSFTPGSAGYVVVQKSTSSPNKSYLLSGPISSYTANTLDAGQGKQVLRFDSDGTPTNVGTVYTNTCAPAGKQNGNHNGLYKNTTGALEVGKGYSVLQASPKNLSFLGNVNNGTISFSPLSTVNRTTPDGSGFAWCAGTNGLAILGNPYPSAIDWALVYASATGINTSVKIWNGVNYTDVSQSDPILANRAIKTGQGFILQVSNFSSNSLTFQNSHRISTNNGSLLRTESLISNIKIELTDTQNEEYKDVLSINFNEKATEGFDAQFDSYDLPGISDVPSLVALVSGNELSTTELPTPTENKTLPVLMSFNNESDYEIKVANPATIPNNMKAYLVDKSSKLEYDLSESTVIPFKKGSYGNYEVQLRSTEDQNTYTTVASNSNKVYSINDKIVVENNNENLSEIAIYDVTGKLVATKNLIAKGKYDIELGNKNQTQMYIVKLSNNTTTNTYKVILY